MPAEPPLDAPTTREILRLMSSTLGALMERGSERDEQIAALREDVRGLREAVTLSAATAKAVHDASLWAQFVALPPSSKAMIVFALIGVGGSGAGVHEMAAAIVRALLGSATP